MPYYKVAMKAFPYFYLEFNYGTCDVTLGTLDVMSLGEQNYRTIVVYVFTENVFFVRHREVRIMYLTCHFDLAAFRNSLLFCRVRQSNSPSLLPKTHQVLTLMSHTPIYLI